MLRWLSRRREAKAKAEALRMAQAARDEAYAIYLDAISRRDSRDQHSAHRILVARVNDVLRLERAA